MGQLCSRPKTVEDKPAAPTDGASGLSDHKHILASLDGQQQVAYTLQPQLETQASEAELSELDVVVQQLRNNHNSVTGSAPELLQQWDHDHKLVLDSMDAAIQRAHQRHSVDLGSPGQHHHAQQHSIPSVTLHTTPQLSQSKLGHAQQHAPPPPVQQHQQHFPQQAAQALQDEPLLKQAKRAYADGRLLQAHRKLQELGDLRGIDYLQSGNLYPEIGPDLAGLSALKLRVDEGLADLKDHNGWVVSRDDDLQVMYRHHAGTSVHSFKFSADFNSPLEHILAMSREFDLTHLWNRYVLESLILAEPSIFQSTLYAASWLPFPFPHIDVVVEARGIDLADEDRCLLILMNTPEDLTGLADAIPAASAKRKRADILPGSCIRLQPLAPSASGQGRVRASVITHMDPHIKHVPAMLLNFVLKVMSPFIFGTIQKVLKSEFSSPDKVLPSRMREKPELYGLVSPRIAEYIHQLQEEESLLAQT